MCKCMTLPSYLLLPYTYSLMLNPMELLAITRTLIRAIETLARHVTTESSATAAEAKRKLQKCVLH